jgi:NAD(P)-dependent dehydrogenase (short-subunit alcohol dehydrogenase family)
MSDLTGKVAVVTGASKGIGAKIGRALAGAGAAVVGNHAAQPRLWLERQPRARFGYPRRDEGRRGNHYARAGRGAGRRNIRVNTLAPGPVETEGTRGNGLIGSELEKQLVASTPLGRIGRPQDVARIAVFLTSDEAGWLTGAGIPASGGLRQAGFRSPPLISSGSA